MALHGCAHATIVSAHALAHALVCTQSEHGGVGGRPPGRSQPTRRTGAHTGQTRPRNRPGQRGKWRIARAHALRWEPLQLGEWRRLVANSFLHALTRCLQQFVKLQGHQRCGGVGVGECRSTGELVAARATGLKSIARRICRGQGYLPASSRPICTADRWPTRVAQTCPAARLIGCPCVYPPSQESARAWKRSSAAASPSANKAAHAPRLFLLPY